MPTPPPLKTATDAFVTSKKPKLRQSNTNRLWVSAVTSNIRYAYIFFSLPYPKGSTVLNGKFRIINARDVSGSISVRVSRVTEKWAAGRVNYNNRPDVTAVDAVTLTKNNPQAGTVWEFDILSILSTASHSEKWWGLRISVQTSDASIAFYSANANEDKRPELEVEWTEAPEAPTEVYPSGGRAVPTPKPTIGFNFQDEAGDTELHACRVMFKNSNTGWDENTGFSSPSYDSGTQVVEEPELDLSQVAGSPTLVSDQLTWLTVSVQDGAGLWSKYSEPVNFKYLAKPTLTLNSPGVAPNDYVEETTPVIDWSLSSGTQTAYKILIYDANDFRGPLWTSGKITSADTDYTLPKGIITKASYNYMIRLLVWDDVLREKNAGQPIFNEVIRFFEFRRTSEVTAVSDVVAAQDSPWPWVDVTFTRATMPDEFVIFRDDEVIDTVDAPDIFVSGTTYSFQDRFAYPRVNHTWKVSAVVNGRSSESVESNSVKTRLLAPMMMELDGSNPMYLMNPNVTPQSMGFQETHQTLTGNRVLITQFQGGFEGHAEGDLADDILPGVTARQMKNAFKRWKKNPGQSYIFYLVDEVMEIVPFNLDYVPRAYSGGVKYHISFDFFEVD